LVTSLARPGGNITGLSLNLFEVAAKQVEVLRDALPQLKRIAFLGSTPDPPVQCFAGKQPTGGQGFGAGIAWRAELAHQTNWK
jgi:hypothetical protein